MAIQLRRGNYSNFDPQKMKPAEVAVVQSGDPVSSDGKGVYVAIQAGVVKRLASIDEMQDAIYNQTEEIIEQIEQGLADDIEQAEAAADRAEAAAQTLEIDNTLTQPNQPAGAKAVGDRLNGLQNINYLLADEIPDTTQSYTFSSGSVSRVTHSRSGTAIRTDDFTYGTNIITEVRTLNTGETLTIQTNLTTLETVITYSTSQ